MVRFKSRYLLFNILYPNAPCSSPAGNASVLPTHLDFNSPTDASVTPQHLLSIIRDAITMQFGDWGSGMTPSLTVKYFSPTTSTGIIRCGRDAYRIVWCALTFIQEILGKPVVIRVIRVSGTIKKVEMAGIRRAKEEIRLVKRLEAEEKAKDV